MDYDLKMLANFFNISLLTDRVSGPDLSIGKNLSQIFLSCSKKNITYTSKKAIGNCIWKNFDENRAKVL